MSFLSGTRNRAAGFWQWLQQPSTVSPRVAKFRLVLGCLVLVFGLVGSFIDSWDRVVQVYFMNVFLGLVFASVGTAELVSESRRTLSGLLRFASLLFSALCLAWVVVVWFH